ncbi:MAG: hypothetical protein ACRCWQ_11495, partial [Bacilli bacterium]
MEVFYSRNQTEVTDEANEQSKIQTNYCVQKLQEELFLTKEAHLELLKQLQGFYEREAKAITDVEQLQHSYTVLRRSRLGRVQSKIWQLKAKLRRRK